MPCQDLRRQERELVQDTGTLPCLAVGLLCDLG